MRYIITKLFNTILLILIFIHVTLAQCPNADWKHWEGGYCYLKLSTPVSWTDARAQCQAAAVGADLVSILTDEENAFIKETFATGQTIGFNQTLWIGMSRNPGERSSHYKWVDGSLKSYLMFGPKEPNNIDKNSNCIQFISDPINWKNEIRYDSRYGFWNDQDCNLPAYPLCKSVVTMPSKCEAGWTYYEGTNSCWKLFPDVVEWDPAQQICKDNGALLGSIKDQAENDFVLSITHTGVMQSVFNMTHIGAEVKPRMPLLGSWTWSDGTEWSWTHWEEGEPNYNDQNSDSYCTMIVNDLCTEGHFYGKYGGWNDITCSGHGETSLPLCKKAALP